MKSIDEFCHEAMVAYLSGIAQKIGNEIHWEYWEDATCCVYATVEFLPESRCIIRNYYAGSDNLQWETRYKKYKKYEEDGVSRGWNEDGTIHWKFEYKDGVFIQENKI